MKKGKYVCCNNISCDYLYVLRRPRRDYTVATFRNGYKYPTMILSKFKVMKEINKLCYSEFSIRKGR